MSLTMVTIRPYFFNFLFLHGIMSIFSSDNYKSFINLISTLCECVFTIDVAFFYRININVIDEISVRHILYCFMLYLWRLPGIYKGKSRYFFHGTTLSSITMFLSALTAFWEVSTIALTISRMLYNNQIWLWYWRKNINVKYP